MMKDAFLLEHMKKDPDGCILCFAMTNVELFHGFEKYGITVAVVI